jgi:hypothetical protein
MEVVVVVVDAVEIEGEQIHPSQHLFHHDD